MLRRLEEFSKSSEYKSPLFATWGAKSRIMGFLARRCSKEFLSFYIGQHPEVLDDVAEPGLMLSAVSEVDVAVRLQEWGLLPEPQRLKFLETVTGYALRGEDLYALQDHEIKSVFKKDEFREFRKQVRVKLVPRLDDVRREWQVNHSSDESADDYMQPLKDSFKALTEEFAGDDEVKKIVERETNRLDCWIAENSEEEAGDKPGRTLGDVETPEEFDDGRSVFDDVDA